MIMQFLKVILPILIVGFVFAISLIVSGQEETQRLYKKIGPFTIGFSLLCSLIILIFIFLNKENTHDKNAQYIPAYFNENGNFVERQVEKNENKT